MKTRKFAIMAKLKTLFDVYKDTFFSHVKQLMKGETSKVQSYKFIF